MDDCDLAARHADFYREQALSRARSSMATGASRTECIDCGEPIPEKRRLAVAGCQRCVECETFREEQHGS